MINKRNIAELTEVVHPKYHWGISFMAYNFHRVNVSSIRYIKPHKCITTFFDKRGKKYANIDSVVSKLRELYLTLHVIIHASWRLYWSAIAKKIPFFIPIYRLLITRKVVYTQGTFSVHTAQKVRQFFFNRSTPNYYLYRN